MRIAACSVLAAATMLAAVPARAQTYDPSYPVCMRVYSLSDGGGYIACAYTSLAQCAASASGLAAQCLINPYFAQLQSHARGRRH
jgi:hypothetical protein